MHLSVFYQLISHVYFGTLGDRGVTSFTTEHFLNLHAFLRINGYLSSIISRNGPRCHPEVF